MSEIGIEVGVVVVRRALKGRWGGHQWAPVAVLPAVPATAPWTKLGRAGGDERFYAGSAAFGLHPAETAHYRDNLSAARPSVWVSLRPCDDERVEIVAVTVDPYEGEALAESVGDVVDSVAMPPEIRSLVEDFIARHHVERAFFKRSRNRADPEALARRVPGQHKDEP